MPVCCPVDAVVVEIAKPIEAVIVEVAKPIEAVVAVAKGLPGDQGPVGDQGPPGPPGTALGNYVREEFIPTAGQTMFILANVVTDPGLTQLYLNGQKIDYAVGYNFSGSMSILIWISSEYNLDTDDKLELYYFF